MDPLDLDENRPTQPLPIPDGVQAPPSESALEPPPAWPVRPVDSPSIGPHSGDPSEGFSEDTEYHPIAVLRDSVQAGRSEPEPGAPAAPEGAAAAVEEDPLATARRVANRLRQRLAAQVLGRDEIVELLLVALFADGHVLLEDFPGSGKTTLAKTLGLSIRASTTPDSTTPDSTTPGPTGAAAASSNTEPEIAPFRRIQFTPDLLPSDVTGVSIFDPARRAFDFRPGPIFAHVVLADEINRTSPKVQAAMLEAMAEKQVTVETVTFPLDPLFFVVATQNPLDLAGTYPLPTAQLDRFLFKIRMLPIDRESELAVLRSRRARRDVERDDLPRVDRDEVLAARRAIDEQVTIAPAVESAIVDLADTLRRDERVLQGPSTRSLVVLLPALQALALLRGRDYVRAEDLETLAPRVFAHRLELRPGVGSAEALLSEAVARTVDALARTTLRGD